MADISEEDKANITYDCKKWLNTRDYVYLHELTDQQTLNYYEIRAILYDVYTNGTNEVQSLFKKNSNINNFYELIFSGKIHSISDTELNREVDKLRLISGYDQRQNEHYGLKFIKPLFWQDVYSLNNIGKEKLKLLESKYKPHTPWLSHYMSPVDIDSKNGLIHIQIKLENDKKTIMEEIEKLIDSAKENIQSGIFNPSEPYSRADHKWLRDSKLIALCDLLLRCKAEGYPTPTFELINKLIFNSQYKKTPTINEKYLPRAKRLLKPHYLYSMKSRIKAG